MYFSSNWICSKSSKNMFVKIVYQGGRVELHERPIMAAELLSRNPKCCVAHPDVFRQPYAVVSPSTTLALGRKYFVVPAHTIARLQLSYSSSQGHDKTEASSSCTWSIKIGKRERQSGGTRLSFPHVHQWQPGLESIKE